jgi:uncharacterized membrane protein
MRKHFTTGLIFLLPIALTLMFVMFIVNLLTKPLLGVVNDLLHHYHLLGSPVFNHPQVILFTSKVIILIFLLVMILFVGIVGRWLFVRYVFRFGDALLHKLPLVNKVYKASQDVVHTILSPDATTFKKVVLVPFPNAKGLSIGLITKEDTSLNIGLQSYDLISVFVPGTPNPTMGFMLLYRKDQLLYTNLTVDEALKYVVSCGVIQTPFGLHKELSL